MAPTPQPGEYATLPTAALLPCPCQPPWRPDQVDALVDNWNDDPDYLHPLRVYRRDGQWWIRNGQHRWMAARRLGVRELPCHVLPGPARQWHLTTLHFWTADGADPRATCACPSCVKIRSRPASAQRVRVRVTRPLDSDDYRAG